jgi:hypothetical protein
MIGRMDMQTEILAMFEDLDYEIINSLDESTHQKIEIAEQYGEYRILFQNLKQHSIRVKAHIREEDGVTGLHFFEQGQDEPSELAMVYYQKLKQRVILEFGEKQVSEGFSFFSP